MGESTGKMVAVWLHAIPSEKPETTPPEIKLAEPQLSPAEAEIKRLREALYAAREAIRFQHPDNADELFEKQDKAFNRARKKYTPTVLGAGQKEERRLAEYRDFIDNYQVKFFDEALDAINKVLGDA